MCLVVASDLLSSISITVVVGVTACVDSGDVANLVVGTDSAWVQLGKSDDECKQEVIPSDVITTTILVNTRFRRRRRRQLRSGTEQQESCTMLLLVSQWNIKYRGVAWRGVSFCVLYVV